MEINALSCSEKEAVYATIIPPRLLNLLGIDEGFRGADGRRRVEFIAPEGLGLARIIVKQFPDDRDAVLFLEMADTRYRQIELALCVISDPNSPRFDVDVDSFGNNNWFATHGRNIEAEIQAMEAGLFPNQVRRGLGMFRDLFPRFESFVEALGLDMIVAEPLTYDNAIRYERYGFDYLTGKLLMTRINEEFRPGGALHRKMDGSTPFRRPGLERTVRGRSWAIHDGILDEDWDGLHIYKMVGRHAGLNTFPDRENEEVQP